MKKWWPWVLTAGLLLVLMRVRVLHRIILFSQRALMKIWNEGFFAAGFFLVVIFLITVLINKRRLLIKHRKKISFWIGYSICLLVFAMLLHGLEKPFKEMAIEVARREYCATEFKYTSWLGISSYQYPSDNWVMQELIHELKPDFIIETGTLFGGTSLFYATVLEKVNENGKVITIDIDPQVEEASKIKVFQERVEVIKGSSVSPEVIEAIEKRIKGAKTVLVTLDSLHTKEHVAKELNLYSKFVSLNSYIVVQDTHLDHIFKTWKFWVKFEGPLAAVKDFLKVNKNFEIDHSKEKYLFTQYPSGFLRRIR